MKMDISKEILIAMIKDIIEKGHFFKASKIAKEIIEILYPEVIKIFSVYETTVRSWTKRISNYLCECVAEGILKIYKKNNTYTIYKKLKEGEE